MKCPKCKEPMTYIHTLQWYDHWLCKKCPDVVVAFNGYATWTTMNMNVEKMRNIRVK